jgi:hypothetical protein
VADQGLALEGRGSLGNAQAALYALPSSAYHPVSSGFNGYSSSNGYNLVTGLGTPVASQVIAGLLGAQGAATVTPLASRVLPHAASSFKARAIFVLASDNSQGTNNGTVSSPSTGSSTTTSNVSVSNPVVIIIVIGSTRIVVILPPVTQLALPHAANGQLAEQLVVSPTDADSLAFGPFSRVGQGGMEGNPIVRRTTRLERLTEVGALIDLVEPFQRPAPAPLPEAAVSLPMSWSRVEPSSWALPFLPRMDRSEPDDGPGRASVEGAVAVPIAPQRLRDGQEDESRGHSTASGLTVAALAGVGCWMTLRESDQRRKKWNRRLSFRYR